MDLNQDDIQKLFWESEEQEPEPEPPKGLYRARNGYVVAGVCEGLGRYLKVNPVYFRLIFAIALFAGGLGALGYFIATVIIPLEPGAGNDRERNRRQLIGGLLMIAGFYFLLDEIGFLIYLNLFGLSQTLALSLFFIILGLLFIFTLAKTDDDNSNSSAMFYKNRYDKVFTGVCGGLANYFNTDANLIRWAFILLTLITFGFMAVAYIMLALLGSEEAKGG